MKEGHPDEEGRLVLNPSGKGGRRATIFVTAHEISVRIGGVPHLLFRRSDVVCIQGYIKNVGPAEPIYFIEVATKECEVVSDYQDRSLWEEILTGLADADVFAERLGEKT